MSKFCSNCGATINDTDKVCGNCGKPNPNYVEQNGLTSKFNKIPGMDKLNPSVAKYIPFAIIGVVALIVLIIVISIISSLGGYKSTLNKFCSAINKADGKAMYNLMSKTYTDYMIDLRDDYSGDYEEEDYIDALEDELVDIKDELEEEYGDNIKVKYEVRKVNDLSKRQLKKWKEEYEDNDEDIDIDKITAVKEVKVKLKIKGKEDSDDENTEFTLVKEKGSSGWKFWGDPL